MSKSSHSNTLVGWREWVSLPGTGIDWIKAKVDTGARSSSLHAFDIVECERDGSPWVRFLIRPWQDSHEDITEVEYPIHDRRLVRSSSGHSEERVVIVMQIVVAGRSVTAEVTLTNRDEMGFRMLLGRGTLRQGFIIDPALSFVGGRAPKHTRHRNRGRV